MTRMNSRAVQNRIVYAQSTEPVDERDGILWVDTSQANRPTFVYSTETEQWEPLQTSEQRIAEIAFGVSLL